MGKKLLKRIKTKIKKYFIPKVPLDRKEFYFNKNFQSIKIQTTFDTLDEIENCIEEHRRGAYLRFGDGDIFLMGLKNDSFQKVDENLSIEIEEAFRLSGKDVYKSLPVHSNLFGFDEGMFKGNHKNDDFTAKEFILATFPYFIGHKIYSPVALHFIASQHVQRANSFLKVLKANTKVFIGNEKFTDHSIKLLFGDIIRIKTPPMNAYSEIDRIYDEALQAIELDSYSVVCIAMGCAGRPLMKRLYKHYKGEKIFLFDFGSLLDGINGNNSRTWLKVNEIDYKELQRDL